MFLKTINRAQTAIDIIDENWQKIDDDICWDKVEDAIYELNDSIAECREVFREGVRIKKFLTKILDELWKTNPEIVDKFQDIDKFFYEYFSKEDEK
jgi:hypothetical protein